MTCACACACVCECFVPRGPCQNCYGMDAGVSWVQRRRAGDDVVVCGGSLERAPELHVLSSQQGCVLCACWATQQHLCATTTTTRNVLCIAHDSSSSANKKQNKKVVCFVQVCVCLCLCVHVLLLPRWHRSVMCGGRERLAWPAYILLFLFSSHLRVCLHA